MKGSGVLLVLVLLKGVTLAEENVGAESSGSSAADPLPGIYAILQKLSIQLDSVTTEIGTIVTQVDTLASRVQLLETVEEKDLEPTEEQSEESNDVVSGTEEEDNAVLNTTEQSSHHFDHLKQEPSMVMAKNVTSQSQQQVSDLSFKRSRARVFRNMGFKGEYETYDSSLHLWNSGCYTLQKSRGKVKSVETFGTCVRVFTGLLCSGWSLAIYPTSGNSYRLPYFKQLSNIQSIGPCVEQDLVKFSGNEYYAENTTNSFKFPDLIDFNGEEKRKRATFQPSRTSPITRHLLGNNGTRVEYIWAQISSRHLKNSLLNLTTLEDTEGVTDGDVLAFGIPLSLGGPGNEPYNQFPQSLRALNQWSMKMFEVHEYLQAKPRNSVFIIMNFLYQEDGDIRPEGFTFFLNFNFEKIQYGFLPN